MRYKKAQRAVREVLEARSLEAGDGPTVENGVGASPLRASRFKHRAAALGVAAAYLLPVAYAVAREGTNAIYNLFAADAYYYLTIAKNTPIGALATFDGVAATNGFHPLWQYLLIALWQIAGPDKHAFIWAVFLLNGALATTAVYLLARTIHERHGAAFVALFLVPGLFHTLAPEYAMYSISAWRVLNGMETSASLLCLALIIGRLANIDNRPSERRWTDADYLAIGATTALLVLARLDNLALVATLPLYLYRNRWSTRSPLYLLAPPIAMFGLYVAANLAAGLPPLPVSGTAKTSFYFGINARAVLDTLLAPFGGVFGLATPDGWKLRSRLIAALLTGCLISIALAVAPLARRSDVRRHATREPIDVFLPLVSFFLVRLSYYLVFIKLSHQGFWYYADIAVALSAVVLLQIKFVARMRPSWKAVAASLWLVVYAQATQRFVGFTSKHGWCPHLLDVQAPRITRCLEAREPNPKLLDSSDGVFAFFLDLPAQPGTGLTANAAGYHVIRTHGLSTYYDSLIRDGYLVNGWSRLCDSGRVGGNIVERPINCRQHRALELYRLKPR